VSHPHDPFLLLEKLARDGLEKVELVIRVDGRPMRLTDSALEIVLSNKIPDANTLSEADREAIAAAVTIVDADADETAKIVARAEDGDEWAKRAYQGIVLRELVRFRTPARRLAALAKKNDPKAKKWIQRISALARQPGHPQYHRSRISVWLLRDAIRNGGRIQQKTQQPEPDEEEIDEESEVAEAEPSPQAEASV